MRVAMAQVSSGTDPQDNLDRVRDHTARAAELGADLVVFGEAMMCRFGVALAPVAQPLDGPWATGVAEIAAHHRIAVVAGMFTPAQPRGDSARVANTLVAATADGAVTSYDKVHLYDAFGFRESDTVAAGSDLRTVAVGEATVGLATCYDIRFPGLFTALAHRGAQVVVVPASWGSGPGKVEQWQVLARARALDSSTFVVAVGQPVPDDPDVRDGPAPTGVGHSLAADPFGRVIAELDETPGVVTVDLDLSRVDDARSTIAVLDNARPLG